MPVYVWTGAVWTAATPDVPSPAPPPPPPNPQVLLGHWDESPLRYSSYGLTNYGANKGVDDAMRSVLGGSGNVSKIMHAYASSSTDWQQTYSTSQVKQSGEFGNAFLYNQGAPDTYSNIIAGGADSKIAAFFNSVPTTQTCYVTMNSEPDLGSKGIVPDDFNRAMARVVNVAAPIYRTRGLAGGVGALLTGDTLGGTGTTAQYLAHYNTWNWFQHVDVANRPQAVYMMDRYSKYLDNTATTYEDIPGICEKLFGLARSAGCTRFGIGEFANSLEKRNASGLIVGTRATQEAWVRAEVPKIKAIPGLEWAIYFHKPTGPESKNAQLLDAPPALPFTAYAQQL